MNDETKPPSKAPEWFAVSRKSLALLPVMLVATHPSEYCKEVPDSLRCAPASVAIPQDHGPHGRDEPYRAVRTQHVTAVTSAGFAWSPIDLARALANRKG